MFMSAYIFFCKLIQTVINSPQPLPRCIFDTLTSGNGDANLDNDPHKTSVNGNAKPYHILHIIPNLETGGTEWNLFRLVTQAKALQFQHHIISIGIGGALVSQFSQAGIPVLQLGINPAFPNPLRLKLLWKELQSFKPDLIIGWLYHGNFLALLIAVLFHCKVIWNIRQCLPQGYKDKLITRFFLYICAWLSRIPKAIIYNSKISALQHEQIGYNINRTQIAPNSIAEDLFFPDPLAYAEIRKQWNLPPTTILVGMIARFHPVKGHKIFFQTAEIALTVYPNLHFVLVGKNITPDNKDLQQLATQYNIPCQQLHLLGEQTLSFVAQVTKALDIAVSCSLAEACSNVILEALACHVPCVVTDVGESRALVQNFAWVVPANDASVMANAWIQILEKKYARA